MSAEQEPGPKQAAAPPPESKPPSTARPAATRGVPQVAPQVAPPVAPPPASEPPRPEPPPRGIAASLKDHKVPQWAIAYLGAALAIAQAYELVANAFGWSNGLTRVVLLTLIIGFPVALTVAWYHGHRALRRVSVGERDRCGAAADRRIRLHLRAAAR